MNIVRTVSRASSLVTLGAETMPHSLHLPNVLSRSKATNAKLGRFKVTPIFAPSLISILSTLVVTGLLIRIFPKEDFGTLLALALSISSMGKPLKFRTSRILWAHSLSA